MNIVPLGLRGGRLVEIEEVARGRACNSVCPGCLRPLIARQGGMNRWHFAHDSDSDCVPGGESWLHNTSKYALKERADTAIRDHVVLPFSWNCSHCRKSHSGNLVRVAARVGVEEQSLGSYRPDLTIYDSEGRPRIALEIAVTHSSETLKLLEARALNLPLFEIEVRHPADLDRLRRSSPLRFDLAEATCPQPPVDVWIGVSERAWGAVWSGGEPIAGETPEGRSGTAYCDAAATLLERLRPGSDVTIHSPASWLKSFVDDLRKRSGIPWRESGPVRRKFAAQFRRHDSVEVVKAESNDPRTVLSKQLARQHRSQARGDALGEPDPHYQTQDQISELN